MVPGLSALLEARNFSGAAWLGQRYIDLGYDDPATWIETITALQRLNRFDEALVHCKNAIKLHPDLSALRLRHAAIKTALGDLAEAEELYREVLARDVSYAPSVADALSRLRTINLDDPLIPALKQLVRSRRMYERRRALFSLGNILVRCGEHNAGFDHYVEANRLKVAELRGSVNDASFGFKRGRFERHSFMADSNGLHGRD
jgi:tetratricopeptide (TPR) repeat protein